VPRPHRARNAGSADGHNPDGASMKGDETMLLKQKPKPATPAARYWVTPGIDILNHTPDTKPGQIYEGESIAAALSGMGVKCSFVSVLSAPQIVTYHFNLENILDITKLKKPLQALSAMLHCNVIQTVSTAAHFALIVPQMQRRTEHFRQTLLTNEFNGSRSALSAALGRDLYNNALVLNVADMPHMLIAGATGSGKSVLLNSIICSMLFKATPMSLQLVMIDPKKVELSKYEGLPHLGCPIVKDTFSAAAYLQGVCDEMDKRYSEMAAQGVKKASELGLPSIVVVIDELADLMLTSKYECETSIIRLAQLGRAAGIHLIIATQRPTVNVITGLIKSNIPCKIALQTASIRDSITILDHKGAESLTGKGDALLKLPDRVAEIRFQSSFIQDQDIENIVNYWKYDGIKDII
jgi:S-DNA-T family DNA segregation ATPase FtsK/SpoIIIE